MAFQLLGQISTLSFSPTPPANTQILWYDDSEIDYARKWKYYNGAAPSPGWYPLTTASPSSGTVTSVGLEVPENEFEVTGTPITDSGSFAISKKTQLRNLVFASSPTTDGVVPSFRALVESDMPSNVLFAFKNTIVASNLRNLPAPVGNVYNIPPDTTLFIPGVLDLEGRRLNFLGTGALVGWSSETSRLLSTGLTTDHLITASGTLPVKNITITAERAIYLDGGGTAALDWDGVNFFDCAEIGSIGNCTNFINFSCAFINSQDLKLFGTFGTVSFDTCIFQNPPVEPVIVLRPNFVSTRRVRFVFCAFVIGPSELGIEIQGGATIPIDQFIIDRCNFSGGSVNYIIGATAISPISDWTGNKGIENSATVSEYFIINNTTITALGNSGVFSKIQGATTSGLLVKRFTNTDNRATYTGAINNLFKVDAIVSCTTGQTDTIAFRIAKNGVTVASSEQQESISNIGRSQNIKVQDVISLNENDFIEIFMANLNRNNSTVTVTELNVIITRIV